MVFDTNLAFRNTTTSLTETETSSALTINGTPLDGLEVTVLIPKQSAGDTMQVTIQHSTNDSTYTNLLVIETVASVTVTTTPPRRQTRRINTAYKYLKSITTVAGTGPDYGAVRIFLGDYGGPTTAALGAETSHQIGA